MRLCLLSQWQVRIGKVSSTLTSLRLAGIAPMGGDASLFVKTFAWFVAFLRQIVTPQ